MWLAAHLTGDLPGLRAMDGGGELVAELQRPPGPPADAYSALVANFHPDDRIFARAIDVGVDCVLRARPTIWWCRAKAAGGSIATVRRTFPAPASAASAPAATSRRPDRRRCTI